MVEDYLKVEENAYLLWIAYGFLYKYTAALIKMMPINYFEEFQKTAMKYKGRNMLTFAMASNINDSLDCIVISENVYIN